MNEKNILCILMYAYATIIDVWQAFKWLTTQMIIRELFLNVCQ